ncbi:MAG: xylulokinase [Cereibacter sphaeroides]|uniref:Xylulose kinase n=1 Tax=Cereibacter sphaeroides TaxID=1063 RepID=A0A2W5TK90_CERSP|nr:MAG: xylulokinase [Cereibacter sphaeroides]
MQDTTVLGLDLGTSALKLLLLDSAGRPLASGEQPLETRRPFVGASEQAPEDWWRALDQGMVALAAKAPAAMGALAAIGLSGQMHGLVDLDAQDRPLGNAILWNDNRAHNEAARATLLPGLEARSGLRPAPGLTACKLDWLARNDPARRDRIARITFCKDWLRLRMTGIHATDPCEAAGSLLFDEARRDWSEESLRAFGLHRIMLPPVLEGPAPTGHLLPELASRWGIAGKPVVVAGAGDGAAGAIGIGAVHPEQGFISVGTSAQISVAQGHYAAAPGSTVQILGHGLPGLWYRAAALQSSGVALSWAAGLTGLSVAALLDAAGTLDPASPAPIFLPYLAGERTPHDNPDARGVLFGLMADHGAAHVGLAVLRGLAFALADGHAALARLGPMPGRLTMVGGGARSPLLCKLVASVLDCPLDLLADANAGAALGAARLALSCLTGQHVADMAAPEVRTTICPDPRLGARLRADLNVYRHLYAALVPEFQRLNSSAQKEQSCI